MSDRQKYSNLAFEQAVDDKMLPFAFDLSSSSLSFVESDIQMNQLQIELSCAILVGIDTETKPTFVPKRFQKGGPNPTSLIQIATRAPNGHEKVFVVDLLKISASAPLLFALDSMLQKVLLNEKCIKMGQGLTADMRELAMSYPNVKAFRLSKSVLETHDVVKYLYPEIKNPMSLKNLVKQYLNCNLIKTQQLSDWSRRPLTTAQMHYAACDALVLLRLYDAMSCEVEQQLCAATESDVTPDAVTATMLSITRTVDYVGHDFNASTATSSGGKKRKGKPAENRFPLDVGSSLLRGWQSEPAKAWFKQQQQQAASTTEQQRVKSKRTLEDINDSGSECNETNSGNKVQHKNKAARKLDLSLSSSSSSIPLPTEAGRHTVFIEHSNVPRCEPNKSDLQRSRVVVVQKT